MTGYEQAIIEGSQTQSYISHMSSSLGFLRIEYRLNLTVILQENQISYSTFISIVIYISLHLMHADLRFRKEVRCQNFVSH